MESTTELLIANRFEGGATEVDELLAPLAELAQDSSSLIVGYVPTASRRREDALPYFHVCGASANVEPVRALVVGGWFGNEKRSPYAIARLIAAMERRASLAAGLEVTAFPVANREANRANEFLTPGQTLGDVRCWNESPLEYVQIIERELQRYAYDLVIFLREHPRTMETDVEAWFAEETHKDILGAALAQHARSDAGLRCKVNPSTPEYRRTFTPIPGRPRQPSEVTIGLSAAKTSGEQSNDFSGLAFALLHALREARTEGRA